MPRAKKAPLSLRVAPELEKFLREKAAERNQGFTGFVEEVLAIGAISYGYEPPEPSGDLRRFAEVVAGMVIKHLEEKNSAGQSDLNK